MSRRPSRWSLARRAHCKAKRPRVLLGAERLEPRQMMAVDVAATLRQGILRIEGTNQDDYIDVRQENDQISVAGITIRTGKSLLDNVPTSAVKAIVIKGHGGDDRISLDHPSLTGLQPIVKPARISGGASNDPD